MILHELNDKRALPYFMLRAEELGNLEELSIMHGSYAFRICGSSHLSSVSSIELDLDGDDEGYGMVTPLSQPRETEHIGHGSTDYRWTRNTSTRPTTLGKLRYLSLDGPLSALHLLDCPALEDLSVKGSEPRLVSHFHDFLSRCPKLRTLRTCSDFLRRYEKHLAGIASSFKHVSFSSSGGRPDMLFKALSEKHTDTTDADSGAFLVLPELESLELIDFTLPLASFIEFIATRWNTHKRRLKSAKLDTLLLSIITQLQILCDLPPSSLISCARRGGIIHGCGIFAGTF